MNVSQQEVERNQPEIVVSVIMPVGACDEHLKSQLAALADQRTDLVWELVCSLNSDEPDEFVQLEKMLAEVPAVTARIVDSSDIRSAAHARNVGAGAARGSLLLFCDSDDLVDPNWVEAMAQLLFDHDAVGGHLGERKLAVAAQEHWRPPATPGALPTFLGHPYLVSANMGVTRSAFEQVGGFDTSLIRGEDIAFSWDLLRRGIELVYQPEAVVHYRHREGLYPMMKQHYLYGRGFSQLLASRPLPDGSDLGGVGKLKPNGQPVAKRTTVHYLRRGSIAAGRAVGLAEQRLKRAREK